MELEEAARALRDYLRRLDLDPQELQRVESRLSAIHDLARRHRARPDALPALLAETEARLAALAESADAEGLARRAAEAEAVFRAHAEHLAKKRRFAATELAHRVTQAMQSLSMAGGRLEIALDPLASPASYGLDEVEFRVATHPKQPLGATGTRGVGRRTVAHRARHPGGRKRGGPDSDIDLRRSGQRHWRCGRRHCRTAAANLGSDRQVLCVTHLPQVAACADTHFRVSKTGKGDGVTSELARLAPTNRVEELARMLGGAEVTAKTRAHAREMLESGSRPTAPARKPGRRAAER